MCMGKDHTDDEETAHYVIARNTTQIADRSNSMDKTCLRHNGWDIISSLKLALKLRLNVCIDYEKYNALMTTDSLDPDTSCTSDSTFTENTTPQ